MLILLWRSTPASLFSARPGSSEAAWATSPSSSWPVLSLVAFLFGGRVALRLGRVRKRQQRNASASALKPSRLPRIHGSGCDTSRAGTVPRGVPHRSRLVECVKAEQIAVRGRRWELLHVGRGGQEPSRAVRHSLLSVPPLSTSLSLSRGFSKWRAAERYIVANECTRLTIRLILSAHN